MTDPRPVTPEVAGSSPVSPVSNKALVAAAAIARAAASSAVSPAPDIVPTTWPRPLLAAS